MAQSDKKASPEAESGIATEGASGLPHNHRLRAEKLVELGKIEDPDGIIEAELIADTKERLSRERSADKPKAKPKPKAKTSSSRKAPAKPAVAEIPNVADAGDAIEKEA